MWKKLSGLVIDDKDHAEEKAVTSESTPRPTAEARTEKQSICHFFRLPAEIRLQIYAYTDLTGNTIEVLYLPIVQTSRGTQCTRSYRTNPFVHKLLYRIEPTDGDQAATKPRRSGGSSHAFLQSMPRIGRAHAPQPPSSSNPARQKRCFSVHGMFSLPSVSSQMRADTRLLVYETNAFAFSDRHYNFSTAIRALVQTLTAHEMAAIKTIHWPLLNALVYQRSTHGFRVEDPDMLCEKEIRAFTGVQRVGLRYRGAGLNNIVDEYSEEEEKELERLLAAKGGWDYGFERQFRRTLAVRGMRAMVGRAGVEVECERTGRANF